MLGVDLSALGQQDLRRLLAVARERGQTALESQVLAEIQARAGPGARQRATPIAMALAGRELRIEAAAPAAASRPRSPRGRATAAVGLAALVVAGLAWGLSPQRIAPVEPAPVAVVQPAALPATEAVARPAQPRADAAPDPSSAAAARAAPLPEPVSASRNPCYDLPTPADRLVCGYPAVAARDRQLREVYARAIVAGNDPRALEAEQAAWQARRDGISEWKDLAAAYDRRIVTLQAIVGPEASDP